MLRLERVSAAYGKHEALHDVTLDIDAGRTTVILGANGAGKTTLLKTIAGLVRARPGARITFDDRRIEHEPPYRIVAAGISLVPEGRRLFGDMTVAENLHMGAYVAHARSNERYQFEKQLALFPRLAERRNQLAKTMSGGEQQMLAIARALMSNPRILLLDEPSLGLGPGLVKDLFAILARIAGSGQSVVLVEQNVHQSLRLADRVHVLENGRIVRSGSPAEIQEDASIQEAYLGLGKRAGRVAGEAVAPRPRQARHAGGFVNPYARTVFREGHSIGDQEEGRMATGVLSMPAGGFFHPFARNISSAAEPQPSTAAAERAPAASAPEIPSSGGFINPLARTPR